MHPNTALLTFLPLLSLAQPRGGPLCAPMTFSAVYKDLTGPSQHALQAQCHALCASSRNNGINNFKNCALGGVTDIEVVNNRLIRYTRCNERCTGTTAYNGDCECNISANDVLTEVDSMMVEGCAAEILKKKVFEDLGWTNIIGLESPSRPCPSPHNNAAQAAPLASQEQPPQVESLAGDQVQQQEQPPAAVPITNELDGDAICRYY